MIFTCPRHGTRLRVRQQCATCLDEKWQPRSSEADHEAARTQRLERLRRQGDELHAMKAEYDLALRTALHEAGHSYVLWAFGHELDEVTITPENGAGYAARGFDGPTWTVDSAALVLAAGAAAERLRFDEATDDGDDERLAEILEGRLAPGWDTADAVAAVHTVADEIVTEGREAIRALASALISRRRLDGEDAEAILAEHTEETATPVRQTRPAEQRSTAVRRREVSPAELWTPECVGLFERMQAAADRGDWAEHRRLQSYLADLQRWAYA